MSCDPPCSSRVQIVIVHLKVKIVSSWFSFFCQTRDLRQDVHADNFLIMKVNADHGLSSSKNYNKSCQYDLSAVFQTYEAILHKLCVGNRPKCYLFVYWKSSSSLFVLYAHCWIVIGGDTQGPVTFGIVDVRPTWHIFTNNIWII